MNDSLLELSCPVCTSSLLLLIGISENDIIAKCLNPACGKSIKYPIAAPVKTEKLIKKELLTGIG